MYKLKLDLESLAVDSFETGDELENKGTVQGHVEKPTTSLNDQLTCGQNTCAGPSCISCSICMSYEYTCNEEFENIDP